MVVTNLDANAAIHPHSPLDAQLQAMLNTIPAHAWYALPNGALTFLNARIADYLGLPKDHPQRHPAVFPHSSDCVLEWRNAPRVFTPEKVAIRRWV
jgi:hypothetical protein